MVYKHKPVIVGIVETHLTEDIGDWEVNIDGYNLCRADSTSRHTGGALFYISNKIEYRLIEISTELKYHWSVFLQVTGGYLNNTFIIIIYSSPK